MTESQNAAAPPPSLSAPKKDCVFWSKILATQYLIRHAFLKSFMLPMIIAQIASSANPESTGSDYLFIVYMLIALHFLSAIFVSDRRFRHAMGFLPHMIALASTTYLFYFYLLQQLAAWLKIRLVIHSLGTIAAFSFVASLHITSISFRSVLRRLFSYLSVFYFVLNAYVLWWSDNEAKLFPNPVWALLLRLHAIICFLVSGGFCLDRYLRQSCQCALYLVASQIFLDSSILYQTRRSPLNLWLLIDFLIDDVALLCGYFYFYQFNIFQRKKLSNKN